MTEEQKSRGGLGGIGDGIRTGIGVLNAFKQAVEETLQEAVDRGDLSADRAKQAMRDVADRVQGVFDDTRERIDFASSRELVELRTEIAALRERVAILEARGEAGGEEGGEDTQEDSRIIVTE